MKFSSSEISTEVEASEKSSIIESSKGKLSTNELKDRCGAVEEETDRNNYKPTMNGIQKECSEIELVKRSAREPVENTASDSDDNSGKEPDENDDLSESLSKCQISERSEEDEVVAKISNLTLNNQEESGGDGQFIEIKHSEIRTPEDSGKCKNKRSQVLTDRGPNGGRASAYSQVDYLSGQNVKTGYPINNHGYGSQGAIGCNQELLMNRNVMCQARSVYDPCQMNNAKRGRDDLEDQPWKYNRPVETKLNNLNEPPRNPNLNVVSKNGLSGGQVTVKTPDIELGGGVTTSGELDFLTLLTDDTYTNSFAGNHGNITQQQVGNENLYLNQTNLNMAALGEQTTRTTYSPEIDLTSEGYISDVASPYSDQANSPPNVEQSMYSPPPLSVDSGLDGCSPRSTLTGYESNLDVYDPNSPLSPGNMVQSNSTLKQNIQTNIQKVAPQQHYHVTSQQNFQQNYQKSQVAPQNFPQNQIAPQNYQQKQIAPQNHVQQNHVQQNFHQNQLQQQNFAVPPQQSYLQNGLGMNYPVTSNIQPQPANIPVSAQDALPESSDYISENLDKLLDVMEVIGGELKQSKKKVCSKSPQPQAVQQTPTPTQRPLPQQPCQQQQPVHIKPVASITPNKVPIVSAAAPVATSAPVFVVQQPPRGVPAPMNIPTTSPKGVPQPGQIVVIQQQPVVFITPQQVNQNTRKQTQYRPIQPKIQPNPGKAGETKSSTISPPPAKSGTKPVQQVSPVPVSPHAQQHKTQSQAPKSSAQQLNLARRLVAERTTDVLKYVDAEGNTYLHESVCRANKSLLQAVLERICRENLQHLIDAQNSKRQTSVYLAVSTNQPEMVDLFVKFGADVNLLAERNSPSGQNELIAAIHCASSKGKDYLGTLNALLKAQDLNLNMFNSDGLTALHCAILEHNQPKQDAAPGCDQATIDSKPIIEALIRAGADPNAQDMKSGKTPLMYALESKDCSLIEALINLVDVSKVRSYFRTQAFNGSTCVKIMEIRKSELPAHLNEKLAGIMSSSRNAFNQR